MLFHKNLPKFRWNILPPSSGHMTDHNPHD